MKKALTEYYALERKIRHLTYSATLLRAKAQSPKSPALSPAPARGPERDFISARVAQIDELEHQKTELSRLQEDYDTHIRRLSTVEQRILRLRYHARKSWTAISAEVNYSQRQAQRIHNRAIDSLARSLGQNDTEHGARETQGRCPCTPPGA